VNDRLDDEGKSTSSARGSSLSPLIVVFEEKSLIGIRDGIRATPVGN